MNISVTEKARAVTSYLATALQLLGCLALLTCVPMTGYSQGPQERENIELERRRREQQRHDWEFENRVRNLRNLGNQRAVSRGSGLSRNSTSSTPKLTEEQRRLLEPAPADLAAFASFLRQPNTGIVRLLPREIYDNTTAMPLRGGGAYYSFYKLSHESGPWSDIRFQNGKFQVGFNNTTLGLITMLGDLPLEKLDATHPAVEFLSNLALPVKYADVRFQAERNGAGFEAGGNLYKSALAAELNTTYILRSTIYNEADTIVAFRTVRTDPDGSLIVLWKSLSSLKAKKLKDAPRDYLEPVW